MSTFITYDDYLTRVSERIISLITGDSNTPLANACDEATGVINDRLSAKYNVSAEFAKTSSSRNPALVRWALSIAVYCLYARIPDEETPERVVKDYDDAMKELAQLQQGKIETTLQRLTDTEGEVISRFRMSNNTPRTHNPFELT
jgi:phage gp36-like protein